MKKRYCKNCKIAYTLIGKGEITCQNCKENLYMLGTALVPVNKVVTVKL